MIKEKKTNPKNLKAFAHKMGRSVEMLMSNYVQVPDDELEDHEYTSLGDFFYGREEKEEEIKKELHKQQTSIERKKIKRTE